MVIKKNNILYTSFRLLMVFFFLAFLFITLTINNQKKVNAFMEKQNELIMEIELENQRKIEIENERDYAQTDSYIIKIAREQLNLIMPDEIVFPIVK